MAKISSHQRQRQLLVPDSNRHLKHSSGFYSKNPWKKGVMFWFRLEGEIFAVKCRDTKLTASGETYPEAVGKLTDLIRGVMKVTLG